MRDVTMACIDTSATRRRSSSTTASLLLLVLLVLVILLNGLVQGEDIVFLLICVSPLKAFQQCGAEFWCFLVPHTPLPGGESRLMVYGR